MKRICIIFFITLTIPIIFSCSKKQKEEVSNNTQINLLNNTSNQEIINNIKPFEEVLQTLTNPQYELVYKLIKNGGVNASLNETTKIIIPNLNKEIIIEKGATPIGIAALFCSPKLLIELIKNGADPKVTINGVDPASYIVKCNTSQMLDMFEPFLKIARNKEKENIKYKNKKELYSANAVMNANGSGPTILNYLIQNGNLEAVQTVIKYDGNINFTNTLDPNNNIYPLLNALIYEKYDIFNFLLEKTGSLMIKQPLYNNTKASILDILFYIYPDFALQKDINKKNFMKSILNSYKKDSKDINKIKSYIENNNLEKHLSEIYTISATKGYDNIIKGLFLLNISDKEMYQNINNALYKAVEMEHIKTVKTLLETGLISDITIQNAAISIIENKDRKNFSENKNRYKILSILAGFSSISPNGFDKKTTRMLEKNKALITYNTFYKLSKGDAADKIIYRLASAGINNRLPFPIKFIKNTDTNGINSYQISLNNNHASHNEIIIPKGATPLIISIILNKTNTIKNLLLMNANTNIKITDNDGNKYSALDYANIYAVEMLNILKNKKRFIKENKSIIQKNMTDYK